MDPNQLRCPVCDLTVDDYTATDDAKRLGWDYCPVLALVTGLLS